MKDKDKIKYIKKIKKNTMKTNEKEGRIKKEGSLGEGSLEDISYRVQTNKEEKLKKGTERKNEREG